MFYLPQNNDQQKSIDFKKRLSRVLLNSMRSEIAEAVSQERRKLTLSIRYADN